MTAAQLISRSLLISLVLPACTPLEHIYFDSHCGNQGGNAWCAVEHGELAPWCTSVLLDKCANDLPDGCAPAKPEDPECYSPCGGRKTLADDPDQVCEGVTATSDSTTGTASTTSDVFSTSTDSDTTETSSESEDSEDGTTGTTACLADDECSERAPFCNLTTGECVRCSGMDNPDAACQADDPTAPVCFEDTCVSCTDDNPGACSGDTPACLENECVECTPDNTEACDDTHPVCGTSNACVVCSGDDLGACGGNTPLCIGETCASCVAHEECPAGAPSRNAAACDYVTGACFPNDSVWHVDGDTGCSDEADGSEDSPLCTLAAAILRAQDSGWGTIILHEMEGELSYREIAGLSVSSTLRLAMLAAEGETPSIQGTGQNPGLRIEQGATVYLDGIIIGQGNTNGLEVLGTVYADAIEVSGNRSTGVLVQGSGRFHAHRSRIIGNNQGGIRLEATPDDGGDSDGTDTGIASTGMLAGSSGDSMSGDGGVGFGFQASAGAPSLYLENCFVAQIVPDTHALSVRAGSVVVLYSTLVGNFGPSAVVDCDETSHIVVRNSVVASRGNTAFACTPSLEASYAAENADLPAWFENFNEGRLYLTAIAPQAILTAARWQPGDPTTDIEGTATRPVGPDNQDVAGADVPGPTESE